MWQHYEEFCMNYADNQMLQEAVKHLLNLNPQQRWSLSILRNELQPEQSIREYFNAIRYQDDPMGSGLHAVHNNNHNKNSQFMQDTPSPIMHRKEVVEKPVETRVITRDAFQKDKTIDVNSTPAYYSENTKFQTRSPRIVNETITYNQDPYRVTYKEGTTRISDTK